MIDYIQYKSQVAWRSVLSEVILHTPFSESSPAKYLLSVNPIDVNELGASIADKQVGYYVADYVGNTYKIIEINVGGNSQRIVVSDDFNFQESPTSGLQGIVYKSALGGVSPYIAPIFSKHLSRTALDNIRSRDVSILFKTREKVEFINTNSPKIEDYQQNFAYLYGEFPDVTLIIIESEGIEWEMQQVPIRNYIDNKLDNIIWDLPEQLSGYIIISR